MSDPEVIVSLTERLRVALTASGLTQTALAERLEVSPSLVSMWLTDSRQPDRNMIRRLAGELGVDATWLDYGLGEGPRQDLAALRAEYRSRVKWTFRREQADGSRDFGNANIFSFSPSIGSFVREVLQNVGDARAAAGQVSARFTVRRIRGNDVDSFLQAFALPQFRPHLEASIKSGQQIGSALESGLRSIDARELILLEVADFGTTGLLGADVGSGNFAALCRNNLDSDKATGKAGGSYGLGKAVLWRMSSLSTVLFLSNLVAPAPDSGKTAQRFFGRTEMVWHELGPDAAFAGPGWFGDIDPVIEDRPISYWENPAIGADLFMPRTPDESGTSILVVGFRDPSSDSEQSPVQIAETIEAAVVEHFWPALARGDLRVSVNVAEGHHIVRAVDVDVREASPESAEMLVRHQTDEVAEDLREPGDVVRVAVPLSVPSCVSSEGSHAAFVHMAQVLVRRDDPTQASPTSGLAQFLRGTGMVVFSKDLSRILVGAQPFHAVVLCGTAAGDSIEDELAERFLRAAEPPAHNAWEVTEKLHREYARGSGIAITNFVEAVRVAVRDVMSPMVDSPPDGPKELAALFKFGEPSSPERAPRLVVDSAVVNDQAAWVVEATIRVPRPTKPVAGRPVLRFEGETGSGTPVDWILEPIKDCTTRDGLLLIPSGKRTARFRAISDPSTHPVPTNRSAVSVSFAAVREVES